MKKFILFSLLLISGITSVFAEKPRREIQIIDVICPAEPEQVRSLGSMAEAWIDYDMGCIEIEINKPLGPIEIAIFDMRGIVVATASLDSDVASYTTLPIPAEGTYTLAIAGKIYYGTGNFTVE